MRRGRGRGRETKTVTEREGGDRETGKDGERERGTKGGRETDRQRGKIEKQGDRQKETEAETDGWMDQNRMTVCMRVLVCESGCVWVCVAADMTMPSPSVSISCVDTSEPVLLGVCCWPLVV